jgi:hypothetical protein
VSTGSERLKALADALTALEEAGEWPRLEYDHIVTNVGTIRVEGNTWTTEPAAVIARTVQTCSACPSQWNAWTPDGRYLYLRYRSGIGTVDSYDDADHETWDRAPTGELARFDTGDRLDGSMELAEFCARAGLRITEGAVHE